MIIYMRFVKTGSSTIIEHIRNNIGNRYAEDRYIPGLAMIGGHNILYGVHDWYNIKDYKYMTIIRDPADWLVSVYNHDISRRGELMSFYEWYEEKTPNTVIPINSYRNKMFTYAKRLFSADTLEDVKRVLDRCWFITTTDKIDKDINKVFKYLGIENKEMDRFRVSGEYDVIDRAPIHRYLEISDNLRERIYIENKIDLEIYNYARKLNEDIMDR